MRLATDPRWRQEHPVSPRMCYVPKVQSSALGWQNEAARLQLILNQRGARTLGIKFPAMVPALADEAIE
jgi:hypothetical protein